MGLRLVIFLTEDIPPVGSTAGTLPICTLHQREKKKKAQLPFTLTTKLRGEERRVCWWLPGCRVQVKATHFDKSSDHEWSKREFEDDWETFFCDGTVMQVTKNARSCRVCWDSDGSVTRVPCSMVERIGEDSEDQAHQSSDSDESESGTTSQESSESSEDEDSGWWRNWWGKQQLQWWEHCSSSWHQVALSWRRCGWQLQGPMIQACLACGTPWWADRIGLVSALLSSGRSSPHSSMHQCQDANKKEECDKGRSIQRFRHSLCYDNGGDGDHSYKPLVYKLNLRQRTFIPSQYAQLPVLLSA